MREIDNEYNESLTWEEFKDTIKRTACNSCHKVKNGPNECETSCINCYGNFREFWAARNIKK